MKRETRLKKEAELRPKQQIANEFIDKLAQILDGDEGEAILKLFQGAANMDKLAEAYCNHCRGPVQVRYPDYKGAAAMLNILFDRVLGKPVQKVEETREIRGRIQLEALQHASIDELKQLAAGDSE